MQAQHMGAVTQRAGIAQADQHAVAAGPPQRALFPQMATPAADHAGAQHLPVGHRGRVRQQHLDRAKLMLRALRPGQLGVQRAGDLAGIALHTRQRLCQETAVDIGGHAGSSPANAGRPTGRRTGNP